MNAALPQRSNPMFEVQRALATGWTTIESMPVAVAYGPNDRAVAQVVGIGDASARRRCGFKGPGAAAWLQQQSVPIPAQPNQWLELAERGLVARLGRTEFLIEDAAGAPTCALLDAAPLANGVYPVLRQDAELVLIGSRAAELLLQTCSVDFAALDATHRPVVLTMMVGVGVTIAIEASEAERRYRIWCDATYAGYLWTTLVDVARDLGGGPVGAEVLDQQVF